MRKKLIAGMLAGWLLLSWVFSELVKDFIFGWATKKLVLWFDISEADVVSAIAQYISYLVPAAVAAVAVALIFFLGHLAGRHESKPELQSNQNEEGDGPAYWSLTETLSWIAFGKPVTAKQLIDKIHSEKLYDIPEEEMARYDAAEADLFEKLRAKALVALGKKNGRGLHEEIHDTYFLSDVSCVLLHNQIDINSENLAARRNWEGPKWRDVQLKREDVVREWPESMVKREEAVIPALAPESLAELEQLHEEGALLMRRDKSLSPGEWRQRIIEWFEHADYLVAQYRPKEAFMFRTISRKPDVNEKFDDCPESLRPRLIKLRLIIGRMHSEEK